MSEKYPRTAHLPWSPGATKEDRKMQDIRPLLGLHVVLTEKLDGSNLSWTREQVFARSHNGPPGHPSFDLAKALHAQYRTLIPRGFTVFGEWCFAVHSIEYAGLPAYFHIFGVRDDVHRYWIPWREVEEIADSLNLPTVPVLEKFIASEPHLQKIVEQHARAPSAYGAVREGVVVRPALGFVDAEFPVLVGKWVREDHVQTDDHWAHGPLRVQPRYRG